MFKIGKTYNRRADIHAKYAGQQQSGISTPAKYPFIFIFTSNTGQKFGYRDEFRPNGLFWYTGEGQAGDMKLSNGNLSILEHEKNHKQLFLFEYVQSGFVRFLGEAKCMGYHFEERPDLNENLRKILIFHLALLDPVDKMLISEPKYTYTSDELISNRERRLQKFKIKGNNRIHADLPPKEILTRTFQRTKAIKEYVLLRANGICEGCGKEAPFKTKSGPYLETHHVHRLCDGGLDYPENVIALCPNCHRRAHYAKDNEAYNNSLIQKLKSIENE